MFKTEPKKQQQKHIADKEFGLGVLVDKKEKRYSRSESYIQVTFFSKAREKKYPRFKAKNRVRNGNIEQSK